jgi:hypothetical protein
MPHWLSSRLHLVEPANPWRFASNVRAPSWSTQRAEQQPTPRAQVGGQRWLGSCIKLGHQTGAEALSIGSAQGGDGDACRDGFGSYLLDEPGVPRHGRHRAARSAGRPSLGVLEGCSRVGGARRCPARVHRALGFLRGCSDLNAAIGAPATVNSLITEDELNGLGAVVVMPAFADLLSDEDVANLSISGGTSGRTISDPHPGLGSRAACRAA